MNTLNEVLSNCTVHGTTVKIPTVQLDRKLYEQTAKALKNIGGKWQGGKTYGFVFTSDPTPLLAKLQDGQKVNLKKDYQFYPTPPALADRLVEYANLFSSHTVLEPSAGNGAIIAAIQRIYPNKSIDAYELMPQNQIILRQNPNINLLGDDFLESPQDKLYDRIIANPPFANNQDIEHLYAMYDRLKPNGRLVCIVSMHGLIDKNKKETQFQRWLATHHAEVEQLPQGIFKSSGTMVSTAIVTVVKN